MAVKNIVQGGTVISALMDADISCALGTCKLVDTGRGSMIGIQISTASAAQDHVGTIYFRLTNSPHITPKAMAGVSVAVTAGAVLDEFVELSGICSKYLEVFYDRTSGGAADTLTVSVMVKSGCGGGGGSGVSGSSGVTGITSSSSGTVTPLVQVNETMTTASTGFSTPFQANGGGSVCAMVSCPDTSSADGEFYFCSADAAADFAAGTYYARPIPVVSKVAGAAIVRVPLDVALPGGRYGCIRYVRTSGGAAAEATLAISVW